MRYPSGRNQANKTLFPLGRHLIYSEGTKTEPHYISNISKIINKLYAIDPRFPCIIPVITNRSKATMELVKYAKEDVDKRLKNNEKIDDVWIFFDKDSFDDFDEACKEVESLNNGTRINNDGNKCDNRGVCWHLCWSNECFEVWIYLHYEDLNTPLDRDVYIKKINNFIKDKGHKGVYKKNCTNLYEFINNNGGNIQKAIRLAKKKDPGLNGIKQNPSTGVYSFAEYFTKYIEEKEIH